MNFRYRMNVGKNLANSYEKYVIMGIPKKNVNADIVFCHDEMMMTHMNEACLDLKKIFLFKNKKKKY